MRDVDVDGVVVTTIEPTVEPSLRVDVRHDLRHAAATILLLLATIRDDRDEERLIAAHEGIAHCARTIAATIDDADMTASFDGTVELDQLALAASRRVALLYDGTVECDTTPAIVSATRADVARLLANLIENSCRAAGPNGTIELRVSTRGEWCELHVGDSGTGFVDALASRGVGLPSIAAIAVRLGGYVTLGQSKLGGALVTVNLPRLVRGNSPHPHGGARP